MRIIKENGHSYLYTNQTDPYGNELWMARKDPDGTIRFRYPIATKPKVNEAAIDYGDVIKTRKIVKELGW